jgi:hypothetical protein
MKDTEHALDFGRVASRRQFLSQAGIAAVVAAGVSQLGGVRAFADSEPPTALTDADILNFALNLEYLEAEFYLRAVYGHGLDDKNATGQGAMGGVTGGTAVPFQTRAFQNYAMEIANDERAHVKFLRAALGDAAVARPAIDLEQSFTTAARAAGLIGDAQTFNPFADEVSFLLGAFIFEDVGVTAYKGAARLIENKDYLEAAAGILAVEAYHAGEIRTILSSLGLFAPARSISNLRDAADGDGDTDQGIGTPERSNIVPTDKNGIAFSRTPDQVLNIVYLGGDAANYGFFPSRLNGLLR